MRGRGNKFIGAAGLLAALDAFWPGAAAACSVCVVEMTDHFLPGLNHVAGVSVALYLAISVAAWAGGFRDAASDPFSAICLVGIAFVLGAVGFGFALFLLLSPLAVRGWWRMKRSPEEGLRNALLAKRAGHAALAAAFAASAFFLAREGREVAGLSPSQRVLRWPESAISRSEIPKLGELDPVPVEELRSILRGAPDAWRPYVNATLKLIEEHGDPVADAIFLREQMDRYMASGHHHGKIERMEEAIARLEERAAAATNAESTSPASQATTIP